MLEIRTNGPLNTIQDLGRPDAIPMGVAAGGAMDRDALMHGNILLGNPLDAAGIEVTFFPFKMTFHESCTFAVTGASGRVMLDSMLLPPNWSMQAQKGQTLTLEAPHKGARSYVTVTGGVDVPIVLGGRSTDIKTGFGGFEGRGLQKGDRLICGKAPHNRSLPEGGMGLAESAFLPAGEVVSVSLMPAAEYGFFTEESLAVLSAQEWVITTHANRVGYRLEGEIPLETTEKLSLFSHGLLPGTIQVPPAGQPIIQMADANTCGGYPKIGIIPEADLCRLAQCNPGTRIRFTLTTQNDALIALRARMQSIRDLAQRVSALRTQLIAQ